MGVKPLAIERYLDEDMWAAVTAAVEQLPRRTPQEADQYERLRFVCALLYLLAPRAGELESHTMGSFVEIRGHWWWSVIGKGRKAARIPVPADLVRALARFRQHLRLPALPLAQEATPLLLTLSAMQAGRQALEALPVLAQATPMTSRQLNRLLKVLFEAAARQLPAEVAYKAEKLKRASAHWGRHTSITAGVDAGVDPRYGQRSARHADARTFALYVHEEDDAWHEELQKLKLTWPKK